MSEHDEIRALLALGAAGGLTVEELVRVIRHASECAACAAESEEWKTLATGLRRLPMPLPPAELLERTRAVVVRQFVEREERRWDAGVIVVVVLFAWLLTVVSWIVAHLLSGSYMAWLSAGFVRPWLGFSIYTAALWLTGGIAAVLLSLRRRHEGRSI